MSWKKIMKIWTDRATKCSICGRPHYIAHISKIPEDKRKKLEFMKCYLPVHPKDLARGVKGYLGSYIEKEGDKEYTVDVYDYPISMKKAYIEISMKAKEEKQPEKEEIDSEDSYENYELFQQLDTEPYFSGEEDP